MNPVVAEVLPERNISWPLENKMKMWKPQMCAQLDLQEVDCIPSPFSEIGFIDVPWVHFIDCSSRLPFTMPVPAAASAVSCKCNTEVIKLLFLILYGHSNDFRGFVLCWNMKWVSERHLRCSRCSSWFLGVTIPWLCMGLHSLYSERNKLCRLSWLWCYSVGYV